LNPLERVAHPLLVQQQNVFRDLQFEQARWEAGAVEHLRN
jgi:hypothetical protein